MIFPDHPVYRAKTISLLCIFVFFSCRLFSIDTIYIDNTAKEHLIVPGEFQVLEDPSGKLTFNDIQSEKFQNQFSYPASELNSKIHTYFWVRFVIVNKGDLETNWILQLPLHTDEISFHSRHPDGTFKNYLTGQDHPFQSRSIDLRTIAFELPTGKGKPVEVYMRLYSRKYSDFSFIISNEERYLEVHTKGYLFLGIIYGILFLMSVYNLIMYISVKEKIYIYYVLYTLSAAFFISWKDGLGFQFLWPSFPEFNNHHYSLGLFLLLISFLLFANDFLELRKKHPNLNFITYGIIIINLTYFLLTIFSDSFFEPLPVLYILSYFYFVCLTIYYSIHKFKPARYLLVSLSCMVGALVVIKLRYMGLLGWNWFIEYILNYAVAIEAIAMSLAISDKISYLKEQESKIREVKLIEEKLKAENEVIKLSNKNLEENVRHTNTELGLLATNLAHKNEFLNYFKKEVVALLKEMPENNSLQKLIKNLDKQIETENDWDQFQVSFDKQHHNFLQHLREKFPHLKPSDLLLCAYIKLNKSNKEIASLLNISVSGVEKKRTRLKEKMQLDSDESITTFLINLK